jgi:hypothetical protein
MIEKNEAHDSLFCEKNIYFFALLTANFYFYGLNIFLKQSS